MHSTDSMIEISGISFRPTGSEREVITDLTIVVGKSEICLVDVDESTGLWLIRLLAGHERPSRGGVHISGLEPWSLKGVDAKRLIRSIGIVSEDIPLLEDRNVRANIELPLEIDGSLDGASRHLIDTLLRSFSLSDRARAMPDELTPTETIRTALARALVREPLVLLLDQPTMLLTNEHVVDLAEILRGQALRGTCVLITNRDWRLANALPESQRVQLERSESAPLAL